MVDVTPNTTLAPRYDVIDPVRNWVYMTIGGQREVTSIDPREVIRAIQRLVGATADGIWGPGTATAFAAWLRERSAPSVLTDSVSRTAQERAINAVAWTTAVYVASLDTSAPDWDGLLRGSVALGTNAQLSQVVMPAFGRAIPAPGGPTPARPAPPRPAPPRPGAPTPPAPGTPSSPSTLQASDAASSLGTRLSSWYQKNKTPVLIGAGVLLVAMIGAIIILSMDSGGSKPRRGAMSTRQAAALLGVPENADPSSVRAAFARAVRDVHPDAGYSGADAAAKIEALKSARDVLTDASLARMTQPARA